MGYFSSAGSRDVFAYNSENDDSSKLPECPQSDFGLAVIDNLLTAVGGLSSRFYAADYTNCLVSFSDSKWVTIFPPMPTKRKWLAVISAQNYLITAGDERGRSPVHSGGDEHCHSRVVHCSQPTRTCLQHDSYCLWRVSLPPGRQVHDQ